MRLARLLKIWLFLALAMPGIANCQGANCASPEFRQFDFWVGDWAVFDKGATTSTAHVKVDRILGGCVLRERYEDDNGTLGESLTTYDAGRRLWHQTWMTNRGRLLTIEGGLQEGSIVMAGAYYDKKGQRVEVRGSWTPVGNTVQESATISADAGKTWQPWFDLSFRQRKAELTRVTGEDAKEVSRMDEEYQAAVKANDADGMSRILADDFVLVTGSGKTFSKEDLLSEARQRKAIYAHQEDTDRTVRVWGDTAVVTAKLWVKGTRDGNQIDYTLWFSDTYVRTPGGWKYVFGQASLPLAKR